MLKLSTTIIPIKGINQDISSSKMPNDTVYSMLNMRLLPSEDNSLYGIVNEKGNKKAILYENVYSEASENFEISDVSGYYLLTPNDIIEENSLRAISFPKDNEIFKLTPFAISKLKDSGKFTELEILYIENTGLQAEKTESYSCVNEFKTGSLGQITIRRARLLDAIGTSNLVYILGVIETVNGAILFTKNYTSSLCVNTIGLDKEVSDNIIYVTKHPDIEDALVCTTIYSGDLNFSKDNIIEGLYLYESEDVLKLYWVDGLNQPRVANISDKALINRVLKFGSLQNTPNFFFDFVPELLLEEEISVEKQPTGGYFPSGVIQYGFTYYNKYLLESRMFYLTPINYLCQDHGLSPEATTNCSFKITVDNVDTNFEYIRIYSLVRTSYEGLVTVKRVADVDITNLPSDNKSITFLDSGTIGYTVDPNYLLYSGGQEFIAHTLTLKDNTMFFGNIVNKYNSIDLEVLDTIRELFNKEILTLSELDNIIYSTDEKHKIKLFLYYVTEFYESYYVFLLITDDSVLVTSKQDPKIHIELKYINGESKEEIELKELLSINYNNTLLKFKVTKDLKDITLLELSIEYKTDNSTTYTFNIEKNYIEVLNEPLPDFTQYAFTPKELIGESAFTGLSWEYAKIETKPYLNYKGNLDKDASQITTFRSGNIYRIGIVFQYKNGSFSNIIFLLDKYLRLSPLCSNSDEFRVILQADLNRLYNDSLLRSYSLDILNSLLLFLSKCKKAQLVIVKPSIANRSVLCSGIASPTLYNINERKNNSPYVFPSWSIRAFTKDSYSDSKKQNKYIPAASTEDKFESEVSLFETNPSSDPVIINPNFITLISNTIVNEPYIRVSVVFYKNNEEEDKFPFSEFFSKCLDDSERNVTMKIRIQVGKILKSYGPSSQGYLNVYLPYKDGDENLELSIEAKLIGNYNNDNLIKYFNFRGVDTKKFKDNPLLIFSLFVKDTAVSTLLVHYLTAFNLLKKIIETLVDLGIKNSTDFKNFLNRALSSSVIYLAAQDAMLEYSSLLGASSYYIRAYLPKVQNIDDLTTITTDNTFYIDDSVVTLNSPDINENTYNLFEKQSVVIKKYILKKEFSFFNYSILLDTDSSKIGVLAKGDCNFKFGSDSNLEFKNVPLWNDGSAQNTNNYYYFNVYLFNKEALSNDTKTEENQLIRSKIKTKRVSNVRGLKKFLSGGLVEIPSYNNTINCDLVLFNKNEQNEAIYVNSNLLYLGNRNFLLSEKTNKTIGISALSSLGLDFSEEAVKALFRYNLSELSEKLEAIILEPNINNAVNITYKTTPHIILNIQNNSFVEEFENLIKTLYLYMNVIAAGKNYLLNTDELNAENIDRVSYNLNCIKLLFGDLNNNNIPTDSVLQNSIWIPISNPEPLTKKKYSEEDLETEIHPIIYGNQGDSYYMRWDCLKTAPLSSEDINQVIDITSFYVESYINLDGRYDSHRGNENNLEVTDTNFNIYNPVYNLLNEYVTHHYVDRYFNTVDNKDSSIVWSETKVFGEEVDLYTKIILSNIRDLDGNKGLLLKLLNFNNNIFAIQDKGISLVIYNDNYLIQTELGLPIEIANSGKVGGIRYLIDGIGCQNKASIKLTSQGIYFVDNWNRDIFLFNGLEALNLSMNKGMHTWIYNLLDTKGQWEPDEFNNIRTLYSRLTGDIYFITKDDCLAFNEQLLMFTSFYSYEGTPWMFNIKDSTYLIKNDSTDRSIYKMFSGLYNCVYDKYVDYSITVLPSVDGISDKIFSNMSFRADAYTTPYTKEDYDTTITFNNIKVWNEYLDTDNVRLEYNNHSRLEDNNKPNARRATLKKKFRSWHCDIPRNKAVKLSNGKYKHSSVRDRIRNPWTYIELGYKQPDLENIETLTNEEKKVLTHKNIIKDITVDYYV